MLPLEQCSFLGHSRIDAVAKRFVSNHYAYCSRYGELPSGS
jgi:hypothetical protein